MFNPTYTIHNNRKLLLSLVYLLMAAFLLWGYIDTFVYQKGHPALFILVVLMVFSFGLYFYCKITRTLEDQYV